MESIERFLCMGRGWWCGIFFLHTHWVIPQSSHHGGERRGGSVCRVKEPRLSGQSSLCWRKNGGGEKRQISSGESKKLKIWADCRRRRVVLDTAWTPRWKLYVCVCVSKSLVFGVLWSRKHFPNLKNPDTSSTLTHNVLRRIRFGARTTPRRRDCAILLVFNIDITVNSVPGCHPYVY